METTRIEQVHFIGVGGVGMSGIARVAFDQGMQVSGSDIKESRYTKQLKDAGITVHVGHDASNIPAGDPVVVVSTAILDNNPELIAAKERGLTIWHRAQMLAHLGVGLETLAVAGTHGKTTTSSMLASVLDGMGPRSSSAASCARTAPTPIRVRVVITWSRPTSPTSPSGTCPRRPSS